MPASARVADRRGACMVTGEEATARETRMARLPLIDPEKTSGDSRVAFDKMPVKLNILRMLAHGASSYNRP